MILAIASALAAIFLGEETERWEVVRFESDLGQAILQGLSLRKKDFIKNDYEYLYDAIRLIAFELGLRSLLFGSCNKVSLQGLWVPEHNSLGARSIQAC